MSDEPILDGGFYLESIASKVGTGDTAKATTMENYYRAEVLSDGQTRLHLLDINHQPTGYSEVVDKAEFKSRFESQPNFDIAAADPKGQQADKMSARAERHLEKKEYLSAEFEFGKALKLDEDNVRANFGLGQTYIASGDPEKAKEIFRKLSNIEAVLEPRNKHIFNECGIQLRKLGMHNEAVRYYKRSLDLSASDENLWFNLGRALWEGGLKPQAQAAIKRCLQLNPGLAEAKLYYKQITSTE